MLKIVYKYVSYLLVIFSFAVVLAPRTFAQLNACNPPQSVFQKVQDSFLPNIRQTIMNNLTGTVLDFTFSTTTGVEMSEYMGCTSYVSNNIPGGTPQADQVKQTLNSQNCSATNTNTCQSVVNQYTAFNTNGVYDRNKFARGKSAGSILGLAYAMQNEMQYEPLPVNTAFYFRDIASRLPIVGDQVLAADTSINYNQPFLDVILDIWKITEAIAFALMAIIMLYVGITIILRKQVSQRVVVTVQYSLPKIVIALILITFSYPIGALMASLSFSMFWSAPTIVQSIGNLIGSANLQAFEAIVSMGVAGIVMLLAVVIFSTAGLGIGLVALIVIGFVIIVGLYLFCIFKAFYLYLKMILAIVTAPLEFAIGAIPGNEDRVMDWFKKMASLGLGIAAIGFTLNLVHLFAAQAIVTMMTNNIISGALFGIFGGLFLFIFGYMFAIKAPEQIDKMINGPKKR